MIDTSDNEPVNELETLWASVDRIHTMAKRCHEDNKDENAWARVLWEVLEVALGQNGIKRLEISSVYVFYYSPPYVHS